MLISIIVPVYNMEKYLEKCVDSILKQTYQNLEIILVNDGSKDSSGLMCDEYADKDQRIKVIHQKNAGLSAARNIGINTATGNYLSFVDSDDWIDPQTYEVLVENIKKSSIAEPDMVRFNAFRGKDIMNPLPFNGAYEGVRLEKEIVNPTLGPDKLGGMFIMGVVWIFLYKRSFIQEHNLRFKIVKRFEDRLFTIATFLRTKSILFVDDSLYHYRLVSDSMSNAYDANRWERELEYMDGMKEECLSAGINLNDPDIKNRIRNEYLLRAILTIHHEFFSNNPSSFYQKKQNIKAIICNQDVLDATRNTKKATLSKKDSILLFFIRNKSAFFISVFESIILLKNKIRKKNG